MSDDKDTDAEDRSLRCRVLRLAKDFERKAETTGVTLNTLGQEAQEAVAYAMRLFAKRLRQEAGSAEDSPCTPPPGA